MDIRIRKNEICVIGLARCDFVFSSTRACFISYGFQESHLEMTIIRNLLEKRGIHAVEAGSDLAPGQSAFCAKICSKIITSQFCIVLINSEEKDDREIPNANVHMEYGLMLGFNKYVIPFQLESQELPFNVAGLDTIKYTHKDFESRAAEAIDQAIEATRQDMVPEPTVDQILETFLLAKKALVSAIDSEGEKDLYNIGRPLGFNLLHDFAGFTYIYFGSFTTLRPETVLWRLQILRDILDGRRSTLERRVQLSFLTQVQGEAAQEIFEKLQIWVVVMGEDDKLSVNHALSISPLGYQIQIFSVEDVRLEIEKLTTIGS